MHYMEIENHDDFCRFDDEGCAYVCDHVGVSIMYDTALDDLEELERKLLVVGSYYMRMAALKGRYIHTSVYNTIPFTLYITTPSPFCPLLYITTPSPFCPLLYPAHP